MKIAYVGPAMAGKHTSVTSLVNRCGIEKAQLIVSGSRHPLSVRVRGVVRNVVVSKQSARAQFYYTDATAKDLPASVKMEIDDLSQQDAIVFVFDSQPARLQANVQQWERLQLDLVSRETSLANVPLVVQLNKVDMPRALTPTEVRGHLGFNGPCVPSVAVDGVGTYDAFEAAVSMVLSAFTDIQ